MGRTPGDSRRGAAHADAGSEPASDSHDVSVHRSHDPATIERILAADGFDEPFPSFTRRLLRHAVRTLLAPAPRIYFIVAEVNGQYAGFAFGHTLGPGLWRQFAREHLTRYPLALAYVVVRLKVVRPATRRLHRIVGRLRSAAPAAEEPGGSQVETMSAPFAWSSERPNTGQVDLFFVRPECRGVGVGPRVLRCMTDEMAADGVTLIEAHADPGNMASVRAFLKAGFEGYRATGGDFYLCWGATPRRHAAERPR